MCRWQGSWRGPSVKLGEVEDIEGGNADTVGRWDADSREGGRHRSTGAGDGAHATLGVGDGEGPGWPAVRTQKREGPRTGDTSSRRQSFANAGCFLLNDSSSAHTRLGLGDGFGDPRSRPSKVERTRCSRMVTPGPQVAAVVNLDPGSLRESALLRPQSLLSEFALGVLGHPCESLS